MTEAIRCPSPASTPRAASRRRNGVVWTALAASSHLRASNAQLSRVSTSERCRRRAVARPVELLSIHGRNQGTDIPGRFHYYNLVYPTSPFWPTPDRDGSTSTHCWCSIRNPAIVQTLRGPYPLGFYHRGLDTRLDNGGRLEGRGTVGQLRQNLSGTPGRPQGTVGKARAFQIAGSARHIVRGGRPRIGTARWRAATTESLRAARRGRSLGATSLMQPSSCT